MHVPGTAVDEFLQELNYLNSASDKLSRGFVSNIFECNNPQVDDSVVTKIMTAVSSSNPVHRATEKDGSFSTSYQHKQYHKDRFSVVLLIFLIIKRNTPFSMSHC